MIEQYAYEIFGLAFVAYMKSHIIDFFTAVHAYHVRPFDTDRNPNTPELAQLFNPGPGTWDDIEITKYVFSIWRSKRGVYVEFILPDGKRAATKYQLADWAKMTKRHMPTEVTDGQMDT